MTNRTQWEYSTRRLPSTHDTMAEILNIRGEAGWELVTLDITGLAVFKRPKIEGEPISQHVAGATPLTNDDVKWVVNEYGELGVRIHGKNYYLYKGESYTCDIFESCDGSGEQRPMRWRPVEKREFGEVCLPLESRHADFSTNEKQRKYFESYNFMRDWQED